MATYGIVKIRGLDGLYYLSDVPAEGDDWEIVEGAWVEIPPDIAVWPEGTKRPTRTLAVSRTDPKHYRVFKYPEEVERAGFEPTGMNYGGAYSPSQWMRLVERIPSMRAVEAIKGNDRPGVMDEALRYIRESR